MFGATSSPVDTGPILLITALELGRPILAKVPVSRNVNILCSIEPAPKGRSNRHERTKDVINNYDIGLDELIQLQPVRFRYNGQGGTNDDPDDKVRYGLVAQAVQPIVSEMVFHTPDMSAPDKPSVLLPDQLSVDNNQLIYAAINAIKELSAKVTALEAQISAPKV